jgi:Glyoxalase-like domain
MELDHVFLATVDAETVEAKLTEFGLVFSRRGRHPGQGTANACALFDNAFFEILWPDDEKEINSDLVSPLGLWQRAHWRETGACPFGISFRPSTNPSSSEPPEVWTYEAAYLPAGASFPIVTPKGAIADPLIFISPEGKAPVVWSPVGQRDLQHRGSQRTLTYVRITRPETASKLSTGVRWFCERGLLSIKDGDNYRMQLVWDHGASEKTQKLDWPVPVTFRW